MEKMFLKNLEKTGFQFPNGLEKNFLSENDSTWYERSES